MSLDTTIQQLLNDFGLTQPSLNKVGVPFPSSNVLLGDLLASALSGSKKTTEATYDFSKVGGAISVKDLGLAIPAGSIITDLWTDVSTALTSGGAATVAIKVGTDTLVAAVAYSDASLTGVDAHAGLLPLKTAAGGELTWTIAGAALTAGKARLVVSYIIPATT